LVAANVDAAAGQEMKAPIAGLRNVLVEKASGRQQDGKNKQVEDDEA
jgi:hypothetical protein